MATVTDRITLTIEGQPQGKGRPRVTRRGHAFTPTRTREYEAKVAAAARGAHQGAPLEGPLVLTVDAYHARPAKPPRGHQARELSLLAAPCWMRGSRYPDADNIAKAIADGLEGIAYVNDSQLVEVTCRRWWAEMDGPARVEVTVSRAYRP